MHSNGDRLICELWPTKCCMFFFIFCLPGTYLRKNSVLKELWLAHNDLTSDDAYTLGIVLKANLYLQFLDISNNNIEVIGINEFIFYFESKPNIIDDRKIIN